MAPVAELVGRVGRLAGPHAPNEHGLTLAVKVVPTGGGNGARATACALSADTLALVTDAGHVHVVHLARQRYTCLDTLAGRGCTSAALMTRLSRRLFVGCADGSIQCFDVATGSHLAQLPGHRAALASLSTKPDTAQLLSASADAVLLRGVATFRHAALLGGAPYGSSQAAFSPAGGLIAAAAANGVITLWDAKSLRELGHMRAPAGAGGAAFALSGISISPDETLLLAGCRSPALLLVYDLRSQALRCGLQLPADMHGVSQVHMLPDSNTAAGAC
jgi:hypothetical protein